MTSECSQIVYKRLNGPIRTGCAAGQNYHHYENLRVDFEQLTEPYKFQDVAELMSTLLCTYTRRKPPADQILTVYSVIKDMLELVALYGIEQANWRSSDDMEAYIDQFKPVLKAFFNRCALNRENSPPPPSYVCKNKDYGTGTQEDSFHTLMDAWKSLVSTTEDLDIPTAVFKLYLHAIDWKGKENTYGSTLHAIGLFTEQYFMDVMEDGRKPHPIDDLGTLRHKLESVFRRCYAKFYKE